MLTKEHVNGITLESRQFKNIAAKVATFCMQKIKENGNVKELSYTEQKCIDSFFAIKLRYNHDSKSCKYTKSFVQKKKIRGGKKNENKS